ncbi:MAG: hypothetical protein ABIS45_03030 [Burkholderiales bacterium]
MMEMFGTELVLPLAFYAHSLPWEHLWPAYAVLAIIFCLIVGISRDRNGRLLLLLATGLLFAAVPFAEEVWIAWNFAKACNGAGTFINKTVQADGYYDGTAAVLGLVRPGAFKFVEAPYKKGLTRITSGDADFVREVLKRYQQENPAADMAQLKFIQMSMDDRTEALVFPGTNASWRFTRIDQPTARYWFKAVRDVAVAYKVTLLQTTLTDTQSDEIIARYVRYYRQPPWFINREQHRPPVMACDKPGDWQSPVSDDASSLYLKAIQPVTN